MIGQQTHFIRLAGCDYRCSWCDSMHAVDPLNPKYNAIRMTVAEIVAKILELPQLTWVTLSGGNPAVQDCRELIELLHSHGYRVAIETQGSIYRSWLQLADFITISPKGPSASKPGSDEAIPPARILDSFLLELWGDRDSNTFVWPPTGADSNLHLTQCIKIVVANSLDLDFAREIAMHYPQLPIYLQPANDVGKDNAESLLCKVELIAEQCSKDPTLSRAIILPQLHVLIWGNRTGV